MKYLMILLDIMTDSETEPCVKFMRIGLRMQQIILALIWLSVGIINLWGYHSWIDKHPIGYAAIMFVCFIFYFIARFSYNTEKTSMSTKRVSLLILFVVGVLVIASFKTPVLLIMLTLMFLFQFYCDFIMIWEHSALKKTGVWVWAIFLILYVIWGIYENIGFNVSSIFGFFIIASFLIKQLHTILILSLIGRGEPKDINDRMMQLSIWNNPFPYAIGYAISEFVDVFLIIGAMTEDLPQSDNNDKK